MSEPVRRTLDPAGTHWGVKHDFDKNFSQTELVCRNPIAFPFQLVVEGSNPTNSFFFE
jgi:hypothetical protein